MAEYAIIFGVVIAAAVGISAIIKEGIQTRVVSEVRKLDDTENTGTATFNITSTTGRTSSASESTNVARGGRVTETRTSTGTTGVTETYRAGE
jgi:hypothetical protein